MAPSVPLFRSLIISFFICCTLASFIPSQLYNDVSSRVAAARGPVSRSVDKPFRAANATQSQIDKARAVVKAAIDEASRRNKARLDHPARNNYNLSPGTRVKRDGSGSVTQGTGTPPPLLNITEEIADAAALLAELDAVSLNGSAPSLVNKRSSFWMENISRKGTIPWGNIDGYQVFRNVKDFGAFGDGVHDDTKAIKNAMMAASKDNQKSARCGAGCYGSTIQNAIVYFPQGTYLVSSTIDVVFGTQVIGDATTNPTIKAAPSFVGMGVLATDEYVPNGGTGPDGNAKEWYINTASFYRQIRNLNIDITASSQTAYICAIHYQVAQATSLQNVNIFATFPSDKSPTTQQGIFAENGSGGQISDVNIYGGNFGIYGGSQQFTAQRLLFYGCKTGVQLIWDWGWTWKSIQMLGVGTGFSLLSEGGSGTIGSIYIMDSHFNTVNTAISMKPASRDPGTGTTGITLDNVAFFAVQHYVYDTNNKEYVEGSPSSVDTWTLGPVYFKGVQRDVSLGYSFNTPRDPSLVDGKSSGLPKATFFERAKPQYADVDASSFIHVKDHGCKGDGSSDDTAALQDVFNKFSNSGSVIFIDSGTYIITDTVTVPPGARIVGEAWSQLAASGTKFSNAKNPWVMLKVGQPGQVGGVEIQDILFTTKGPTPGVILVEWNLLSDKQGSAGMWDCHARLGGAIGTGLTPEKCSQSAATYQDCSAGSLMMHITQTGSAYLENVWLWVADHMTDDPDWKDDNNGMTMISIYNARGLLVESKSATWLYGTASEHSVFYQYNINNARHLFAGMIQTESPYYQPSPLPPDPYSDAVGKFSGDPDFSCKPGGTRCDKDSWALLISNSQDIFIAGAGLYSWFVNYDQTCVDTSDCQDILIRMERNKNVVIHNLITIGSRNMLMSDGDTIPSKDNLAIKSHPYWSQLTVFYPIQNTPDPCKDDTLSVWHPGYYPHGELFPARTDSTWPGRFDGQHVTYVNLVNGSPHDFILDHSHSNQIDPFDFATVPAGASRQNKQVYDDKHTFVDDKGEAYYHIDGTTSTFQIWARTHDTDSRDMREVFYFDKFATDDQAKGSSTELADRGGYRAFNFVITGSEKYGHYWTSLNPPTAWMHSILDVIGERKLRHVSMIGSHDAGMSTINGRTNLANPDNTDTQHFDITGQLLAGSRFFDIRPVVGNGGQYLTGHYNLPSDVHIGGNGEYLTDIVKEINAFTADNPELIILHISHAFNTDIFTYRGMNDTEYNNVFDIFEGLDHLCGGMEGDLTDKTMNDFIGNNKACVIIISDNGPTRPNKGIYKTSESFKWDGEGHWSNTNSLADMVSDQLSYLSSHRSIIPSRLRDDFLVMQWILTPSIGDSFPKSPDDHTTSIESFATRWPYDALFWKAYTEFSPWSYPNVILLDYVGELQQFYKDPPTKELIALAMAINLAIASKNCYVGGGTIY